MTTCLGESCSFDLPSVGFVNLCVCGGDGCISFHFGFEGEMWILIVFIPNLCQKSASSAIIFVIL